MFMNEIIWSLSLVLKQRGKGENGLGYRSQRVGHNWTTELNWTGSILKQVVLLGGISLPQEVPSPEANLELFKSAIVPSTETESQDLNLQMN